MRVFAAIVAALLIASVAWVTPVASAKPAIELQRSCERTPDGQLYYGVDIRLTGARAFEPVFGTLGWTALAGSTAFERNAFPPQKVPTTAGGVFSMTFRIDTPAVFRASAEASGGRAKASLTVTCAANRPGQCSHDWERFGARSEVECLATVPGGPRLACLGRRIEIGTPKFRAKYGSPALARCIRSKAAP